MSTSEIIGLITLIITSLGFGATVLGLCRNRNISRAGFIKELIEKMRGDDEIRDYIYYVDDEDRKEWYKDLSFYDDDGTETKKPNEKQVDKALTCLSYLCYLEKHRLINKKEFSFFKYEIEHVLCDKSTIDYLCNLYHYSIVKPNGKNDYKMSEKKKDKEKKKSCPFTYLIKYGEKNGSIKPDFYQLSTLKKGRDYANVLFQNDEDSKNI